MVADNDALPSSRKRAKKRHPLKEADHLRWALDTKVSGLRRARVRRGKFVSEMKNYKRRDSVLKKRSQERTGEQKNLTRAKTQTGGC